MKGYAHGFGWKALKECATVGAFLGLAHAISETTILGFYGIGMGVIDLVLIFAVYLAGGASTGILSGLVVFSPPLRDRIGSDYPHRLRRIVWVFLVGIYVLALLRIVGQWSGSLAAAFAFLMSLPVLVGAYLAVSRRAGLPVLFWASMAVASMLCSLELVPGGWSSIAANRSVEFALLLLLGVGLCCAALGWTARARAALPRAERNKRFALLLAGLGIVWIAGLTPLGPEPGAWLILKNDQPQKLASSVPNVLLVVLDTVRADHLDLFGYHRETMPNLRRFAERECQVVNRMLTTSSWTLPSHASMFTGLYPSTHGAHTPFVFEDLPEVYAHPMRGDVPTLPEFLAQRGYQTATIAANYGALRGLGVLRGFAHQDVVPGPPHLAASVAWFHRLQLDGLPTAGTLLRSILPASVASRTELFDRGEPPYRRARQITNRAKKWLDQHGSRPFFLFLNYFDAHQPYLPIPDDDERFASRPEGEEWRDFPTERFNARRRQQGEFAAQEAEFLVGQYDAELVSVDRELARLLDYLKKTGHFDNTLILVTTDHGEAFFEHGFLEHGNALYQPEVGGFLLMKMPASVEAPEPSPHMQFVDFFPTIAAILQEPAPTEVEGVAWGHGRDYALAEMFCRTCGAGRDDGQWPESFRREQIAVVVDDKKLLRSTNAADEIYDLRSDPHELTAVIGPESATRERVEEVLMARNRRLGERLARQRPGDKELMKNLRSLGYVQ